MSTGYWLGLDIGTGGSRALLVTEDGSLAAAFTAPHEEMQMPHPKWAEQRPEDWWAASQAAIRGVLQLADLPGHRIRGVGLSGQMHGLVLLDPGHRVIRPALIWCDQRSQAQVDAINNTVTKEKILEWTANPVVTGFTLPKLLWVRDHEPRQFDRVRKVLLPKDYVRFQLTGEFATEVSDASGTAMFDVVKRAWSRDLMSALDLDASLLPPVFESAVVSGKISQQAAGLTGLAAETPVVGGGGDQAASAIGNGIVEEGIVSCTLGTSGVVFAHMDQPRYDPLGRVHTFCHAVPGKWHVMGVTQGAGLSLQWLRSQLAPEQAYDALTAEAATAPAGSQGLFWLPYLMGERTPHLDASARAAWIGLTARHTRADLIRSVIEGVSYSQKDGLEIMENMGLNVEHVRISGGGGRSPFWRQLLASVLDKPVVTLATQEGSAYGAALLAIVGTGTHGSIAELCRTAIRENSRVPPERVEAAAYAQQHRLYQGLYPALKSFFGQLE